MTIALCIIAYLAVGATAAAYRAYIDPRLVAEEGVTHRKHTLFFREGLFFSLVAWPIYVPFFLALPAMARHFQERGRHALERQRLARIARENEEAEIERIIRETIP